MKRQVIGKNETEIDRHFRLAEYELKQLNLVFDKAKTIANKLTIEEFYNDPYQSVENSVCEGVSIKGIKVSNAKVLELAEINLDWLKPVRINKDIIVLDGGELSLRPNLLQEISERFTQYAETDEELVLLKSAKALIKAIEAYQVLDNHSKIGAVADLTRNVVSRNPYNQRLEVNAIQLRAIAKTVNLTKYIV